MVYAKVASKHCESTIETKCTLDGLIADTEYSITIKACDTQDRKFCSLESQAIQVTTMAEGESSSTIVNLLNCVFPNFYFMQTFKLRNF